MPQTQARRNLIARSHGEHCHGYPQLMLGWRGAMDYELSPGGERLVLGQAAILPPGERHLYLGRDDSCEVLVIDLDADDPCLTALEQSCALDLRESLFAKPQTVSLPPSLIPMVEFATRQVKAPKSPAQTALLNHQLAILFVSQLSELVDTGSPEKGAHERLSAPRLDAFVDERLATPPRQCSAGRCLPPQPKPASFALPARLWRDTPAIRDESSSAVGPLLVAGDRATSG